MNFLIYVCMYFFWALLLTLIFSSQIYCVGGMGTKKDLSSVEKYSPSAKKWTILPNQMKVQFYMVIGNIDCPCLH